MAFAALGLAVAAHRSAAAKVGGVVSGAVAAVALTGLLSGLAEALIPDTAGWVEAEVGLWIVSLLAVAATLIWYSRGRRAAPTPPTGQLHAE